MIINALRFVSILVVLTIAHSCQKSEQENFQPTSSYDLNSSTRKAVVTINDFRSKWKSSSLSSAPKGIVPLQFITPREADAYISKLLGAKANSVVSIQEAQKMIAQKKTPIAQTSWFGSQACNDTFNEDISDGTVSNLTGFFNIIYDCQSNSGNGSGEIEVKEVEVTLRLTGFTLFQRYEDIYSTARMQSMKLRDNTVIGAYSGIWYVYIGIEGLGVDLIATPVSSTFAFPHYIN